MAIPATIHDDPRIYSNGAEHLPVDHRKWTGTFASCNLRAKHGFFGIQAGFLDAPECIAAGSMIGNSTAGNPGYAVATTTYRD